MDWLLISLNWYFYIFLIGIIFLPSTYLIFKKLNFDYAYPFSKTIGIIFLSYLIFSFSFLKILPFSRQSLFIILLFFLFINLLLYIKKKENFKSFPFYICLLEEFLFLIAFLFWVYIRGQEPSIRTLEKFMDFGFINSILRTKYFPPIDIWYPPEPINYYYFGHLTGAVLIKIANIKPAIGYNLILSTIFALALTQVFSFSANLINLFQKKTQSQNQKNRSLIVKILISLLTAFIVNLGGNLHTIYILTKGYPNENPIPFWKILSFCNSLFPSICQKLGISLQPYWYPNATRFIPYTIHEFPSYSYVVADLHGHVFDIPFVLLTLIFLFKVFLFLNEKIKKESFSNQKISFKLLKINFNFYQFISIVFLGFLTAINYMTNAFDGPIYILFSLILFLLIFGFSLKLFYSLFFLLLSFFLFSLPFSSNFKPFVSGIGVNCGSEILNFSGKIGPLLFEKGNCQSSPLWMLFILWGFFITNFIFFIIIIKKLCLEKRNLQIFKYFFNFIFLLFSYGILLVIIPEFFYIKDIYPAHFRANTMFKLGYQAFILMGLASGIVFFLIKEYKNKLLITIYSLLFVFIFIYPFYAIPSYYGSLNKNVELDGSLWLNEIYPQDKEIIDWLNQNIKNQVIILEAQGDSYSDYERISAMTGLPTVAGWLVHEWLWRGSADFIGKRIPDVVNIYESDNLELTKKLIKKYNVSYVIISQLEKNKYPKLKEEKFKKIGKLVFISANKKGTIYQVK